MTNRTIAVAMSGGVDSSTVAAVLRADGHSVVGLTMQLWNQRRLAGYEGMPETVQGRCCSLDDVYDARRVAQTIGIPYYVVNHEERFEREVVRPFVEDYLAGRTPIPCSLCNNHLKFDQQLVELEMVVAQAAWNRCAAGEVILDKGADNLALEALFVIDHVIGNPDGLGDTARVVDVVERAAAPLDGFGHAFVTGEAALVPELHGEPNHAVAVSAQHGCDGRRVDSSGHGYGNGSVRHQLQFSVPLNATSRALSSERDISGRRVLRLSALDVAGPAQGLRVACSKLVAQGSKLSSPTSVTTHATSLLFQ